jgi:hypothetical protein
VWEVIGIFTFDICMNGGLISAKQTEVFIIKHSTQKLIPKIGLEAVIWLHSPSGTGTFFFSLKGQSCLVYLIELLYTAHSFTWLMYH